MAITVAVRASYSQFPLAAASTSPLRGTLYGVQLAIQAPAFRTRVLALLIRLRLMC